MFNRMSPDERAKEKARQHALELARQKHQGAPDRARQKQAAELAREKRRRFDAFNAGPAERARTARQAGAKLFQIDLPLSKTTAQVVPMFGTFNTTSDTEHATMLDAIEAQGWRLENVGYVYRITGSTSRDKFLASGQQEAVAGEIVGIYLFRATEEGQTQEPLNQA
jgi:hypothetical protein